MENQAHNVLAMVHLIMLSLWGGAATLGFWLALERLG